MAEIIKLVGAEITIGATANTVANSVVIRVTNANTTTASLITIAPVAGANTSTTLLPSSSIVLQKPFDAGVTSALTSLVTASPLAFS